VAPRQVSTSKDAAIKNHISVKVEKICEPSSSLTDVMHMRSAAACPNNRPFWNGYAPKRVQIPMQPPQIMDN